MAKVQLKPNGGGAGDTTDVRKYIEEQFPGAKLSDEHYGEVHYQVCKKTMCVSSRYNSHRAAGGHQHASV